MAVKGWGGFVQIPDYVPTLLRRLELEPVPRVTGKDFWPLVTGETRSVHDYATMAYGWIGSVRTPEWNFSAVWNPEEYSGKYPPQLYSREKDPDELTDVADKYPDVVADLKRKLDDYIEAGRGFTRGSFPRSARGREADLLREFRHVQGGPERWVRSTTAPPEAAPSRQRPPPFTLMPKFEFVDYLIVVGYLSGIVVLATHFSGRQKSLSEYFHASASIPWWAVGISNLATAFSPHQLSGRGRGGFSWKDSRNSLVADCLGLALLPLTAAIWLPLWSRLRVLSIYEYLEIRYHPWVRSSGAHSLPDPHHHLGRHGHDDHGNGIRTGDRLRRALVHRCHYAAGDGLYGDRWHAGGDLDRRSPVFCVRGGLCRHSFFLAGNVRLAAVGDLPHRLKHHFSRDRTSPHAADLVRAGRNHRSDLLGSAVQQDFSGVVVRLKPVGKSSVFTPPVRGAKCSRPWSAASWP